MIEQLISLSATIHPVAQSINLKFIFYFFLPTSHASFPSLKSCSFLSIPTPVQKSINSQFNRYISNFCFASCIFNPKSSEWSLKNIITTYQFYVSNLPKLFPKNPKPQAVQDLSPPDFIWCSQSSSPHFSQLSLILKVSFSTQGRLLPLLRMISAPRSILL